MTADIRRGSGYVPAMPLSPETFYQHVLERADVDGRLPLSRMTGWEIFPFEPDGLRVVPLEAPQLPEAPRAGEDESECWACQREEPSIWSDDHWRITMPVAESGVPLVLMVRPNAHYDLPNLPEELAAELGRLLVHLARAIEALPHIARAHISRWGDGGAHLHLFVFARPEGFAQLRGTCLAIWDDLLPPVPAEVQQSDAAQVAKSLVTSYGGVASMPA
jgi:hypothetical protein